eukprot:gene24150-9739_t
MSAFQKFPQLDFQQRDEGDGKSRATRSRYIGRKARLAQSGNGGAPSTSSTTREVSLQRRFIAAANDVALERSPPRLSGRAKDPATFAYAIPSHAHSAQVHLRRPVSTAAVGSTNSEPDSGLKPQAWVSTPALAMALCRGINSSPGALLLSLLICFLIHSSRMQASAGRKLPGVSASMPSLFTVSVHKEGGGHRRIMLEGEDPPADHSRLLELEDLVLDADEPQVHRPPSKILKWWSCGMYIWRAQCLMVLSLRSTALFLIINH